MNGIIAINKQKGPTSFDIVAKARKIFGTRKIGHGGTLDPMAEGVLPLFVGKATKAVDFCPDDTKEYVAGFKFGITTDTQDITGKILTQNDSCISMSEALAFNTIKGDVEQIPPMYSARRVNGKRLYELARKGHEVERPARKIFIYAVELLEYSDNCGIIKVSCSKGTYIRTLIHDFGQQLRVGAAMTSLTRTKSAGFSLSEALTLEQLEDIKANEGEGGLKARARSLSEFYSSLPRANLDTVQTRLFSNGVTLLADKIEIFGEPPLAVYDCNGDFRAIARIDSERTLKILQRF